MKQVNSFDLRTSAACCHRYRREPPPGDWVCHCSL